jgi:hypothetical protein
VVLTQPASIELPWQAHSWRAQYAQLVARATAVQAASEAPQATLRDLTPRLYGTQREKATRLTTAGALPAARPRTRGHQPGSRGHGRRDHSPLPGVVAAQDHSALEQSCPVCGAAFRPFPGPAASPILAVQGHAQVRRRHRQRSHNVWHGPPRARVL